MQRLLYISITIFFLLAGIAVCAQERGEVSVHADPRLALLISSTKSADAGKPSASASTKTKPGKIKTIKSPLPVEPKETAKTNREVIPAKEANGKGTSVKMPAVEKPIDKLVAKDKVPAVKDRGAKDKEIKPAKKNFLGESHGPRYTGPGFRVQIYNGSDRSKALRIKADFISRNPGVHTYLNYASPCYKVRAGDFRKRADAEGMFKDANTLYSPCMIVPDEVSIKSN